MDVFVLFLFFGHIYLAVLVSLLSFFVDFQFSPILLLGSSFFILPFSFFKVILLFSYFADDDRSLLANYNNTTVWMLHHSPIHRFTVRVIDTAVAA